MAKTPDLSQLLAASQEAPVEGINFYKTNNQALASVAVNAAANTPESQIAAQQKQTTIAQRQAEETLSIVMQARERDLQAHELYMSDYQPRSDDYDMLQQERLQTLKTLTEEESDPEKNNIFLHPIKTAVSAFKSAQLKEKEMAIVTEMNALSDAMAQANREYIATRQYNAEELAFNLQSQVDLKSKSAMIAAQQAERSAVLRYEDTQKDIAVQLAATQGLKAVSPETAAGVGAKAIPTDAELAVYKANKLKTVYNPVVTDADRPNLLRAFKSEPEDVQAAVSQLAVRYTNYIKEGAGSTENPIDFTEREIVRSVNGQYARGLDKLTESRYSEIANIGLQARVKQIAAAAKQGDLAGLSKEDKGNAALMQILQDKKNLADETELQLQIKGALEGDFSNSLNQGLEWLKQDMANPVTNQTVTDKRSYVDPGALSSAMTNSEYLLSNIPQKYLQNVDQVQLKSEAEVVAKVAGMNGGNLATHKLLGANEFLKKLGVTSANERFNIMHNWIQKSVIDTYRKQGAYSNLSDLAQLSTSAKNEEFVIPLVTRESKGGGIFGKFTPSLPSVDLSTPAGLATYIELAEKGVLEQYSKTETAKYLGKQGLNVLLNQPLDLD